MISTFALVLTYTATKATNWEVKGSKLPCGKIYAEYDHFIYSNLTQLLLWAYYYDWMAILINNTGDGLSK